MFSLNFHNYFTWRKWFKPEDFFITLVFFFFFTFEKWSKHFLRDETNSPAASQHVSCLRGKATCFNIKTFKLQHVLSSMSQPINAMWLDEATLVQESVICTSLRTIIGYWLYPAEGSSINSSTTCWKILLPWYSTFFLLLICFFLIYPGTLNTRKKTFYIVIALFTVK